MNLSVGAQAATDERVAKLAEELAALRQRLCGEQDAARAAASQLQSVVDGQVRGEPQLEWVGRTAHSRSG